MTAAEKHRLQASVGAALAVAGHGLAALGPIGVLLGVVVSAAGAGLTAYGAYKLEPPREVWTPERRALARRARAATGSKASQVDDDETPRRPGAL